MLITTQAAQPNPESFRSMLDDAVPPQSFRGNHCQDCGSPISRFSRGRCKLCGYIGLKRDVPGDFASILRKLGSQDAARYYKAGLGTITRWRKEIGLLRHERATSRASGLKFRTKAFSERPLLLIRDYSIPGQAADFLRKWGAVYRCDERGKANSKGSHWRRNYSVLTDDQIMHQAGRLGWRPFDC